jgi:predicted phosphodiesterase
VARLREMDCPIVMGNADAWLLSGIETATTPRPPGHQEILADVRRWSLAQLAAADREFIASFPPTVHIDLGTRTVLGFHGSPSSFDEILLPTTPSDEFERALAPHAAHVLCGGHVHLQFQRRVGDSFHFNPGSVGLAYHHDQPPDTPAIDPWAEYAILDVDRDRVALEFRRVPYDVGAYLHTMRASGRPHAEFSIRQHRAH